MNKSGLVNQSKQFKKEADQLLQESGIIPVLEQYGQVQFTGSYEYDLMLSGDIDIYVINPKVTKNLAVKALNEFIGQGFFKGYLFYDFEKYDLDDSRIKGYYIGLKIPWQDRKWKIDIWFTKGEPKRDRVLRKRMARLTGKERLQILKLKQFRDKQELNIDSYTIYQVALEPNKRKD